MPAPDDLLSRFPRERTWLLPALQALQHRDRWLSPAALEAAADHLLVSTDEEQTVQLSYQGGGRFLRPGDGDSVEYFLGWPDHSEWFGYAWFGLPMDLAAKQAETCP